jgi:4-hydroxy-3-polyprenylbenzoate decarboxylase
MGYRNLRACLADLEAAGQLVRIEQEVDPRLEAAEIHRRVHQAGGPAVYYARVKGTPFPMVSNLFGTIERARFLFRDTLRAVEQLVAAKGDPARLLHQPWRQWSILRAAWNMRPRFLSAGPVLDKQTTVDRLPQLVCWPQDGGPFITLPQVYTEDPRQPGWQRSNLGMYRVQLAGNQYRPNEEVGLHYQIHRGIGVHHAAAIELGVPLRVNVLVGGPPALTVAAVMPLPEGISELMFAGALSGRRLGLIRQPGGPPILAEADFCLTGTVDPQRLLPEGPFGDHLGYYAKVHDFPVLRVERVWHRVDAVWPFTVVGRPPQEDTTFGRFIHELTGPVIPQVLPGVKAVHAVDDAGVHPLLLALGSERYVPYEARTKPRELLTQANAILGQGQLSLAKYLWIAAVEDDPRLDVHDVPGFFQHMLERVDWQRDLHFHTCTTMDTLDYSGTALNEGSKLVIAAAGPRRRSLPAELPPGLSLGPTFSPLRLVLPGIVAAAAPPYHSNGRGDARDDAVERLAAELSPHHPINQFPLVVLVDDAEQAAASLRDFLWITFTRSNPATDVHGVGAFVQDKHWGCTGALLIDARRKPHHAPPLEPDPAVARRVEALAAPGGPLHGII